MKEVTTASGKKIYIYDNLFTFSQRSFFYSYFRNLPFRLGGIDTAQTEHQSDITLISPLDAANVSQLKFFTLLPKDEIITDILDNYQVINYMVNLSTPSDCYHIHDDCGVKDGITLLYYANVDWKLEWAGETVFLNDSANDIEFVSPYVPGRVVLFDGSIPHMIRTATHKANNLRFTFAARYERKHNELS
jgi:hypothetical protein